MRTPTFLFLHTLKNRFTGIKTRVNLPAGKSLGGSCLFLSQSLPPQRRGSSSLLVAGGDAKSPAGLGNYFQGQLRYFLNHLLYQEQAMFSFASLKNKARILPSYGLLTSLAVGVLLISIPSDLMAHDGDLLKDEITKLEQLFTGGYMRLGLLGVCGFAAIYGIVKQSGWIFASGILGCMFAYFMKDWITKTFTLIA